MKLRSLKEFSSNSDKDDKTSRKQIPKAIRQQVWIKYMGKKFENKCTIIWCTNIISVFNFHAGHVIPDSKGGLINIENLRPICSNCNLSMSDNYTIYEWNLIGCKKDIGIFTKIYYYILSFWT